jgi:hypothetical protein
MTAICHLDSPALEIKMFLKPRIHCANRILSSNALAPTKLHQHIETNHLEYKDKYFSSFKLKLESLEKSKLFILKIVKMGNNNEQSCGMRYKQRDRAAIIRERDRANQQGTAYLVYNYPPENI